MAESFVPLRVKKSDRNALPSSAFLPTTREEMHARGWDELDILIVTGDAYVDHPAFGPILDRALPRGARLPRRRHRPARLANAGRPLAHGAAAPVRRHQRRQPRLDAQQADGAEEGALRGPVLARRAHRTSARTAPPSCTRTSAARRFRACPSCSAASRRRCAASRTTTTGRTRCAARSCSTPRPTCSSSAWASGRRGRSPRGSTRASRSPRSRDVRGTAYVMNNRVGVGARSPTQPSRFVTDGKHRGLAVVRGGRATTRRRSRAMSRAFQLETNPDNGRPLLQPHGDQAVYFNRPGAPARRGGDGRALRPAVHAPAAPELRGERIPAYETVKHSIVTMRGCFGGCTFCSITEHEGRVIQSRSAESVLREVRSSRAWTAFAA